MAVTRVTTLVAAAADYALIDLATVKDELDIPSTDTSQDNFLNRAIAQVSAAVARYCNRAAALAAEASFPVETVADLFYPDRDAYPYQVPGGMQPLQLSHWPIASFVQRATTTDASASTLNFASAGGITTGLTVGGAYAPVQGLPPNAGPQSIAVGTVVASVTDASLTLSAGITEDLPAGTVLTVGSGSVTTTVAATTDDVTLSIVSDAGLADGQTVSGSGIAGGTTVLSFTDAAIGLSLPLTNELAAGVQITFGLSVAQTDPPGNTSLLVAGADFTIDAPTGQLIRLDQYTQYPTLWPAVQQLVTYSGGYDPIPDDVVDAVLRWICSRQAGRKHDPNLRSVEQPGIGIQTYWVGGPPMSGGVPREISSLLDRYRVPTVA